MTVAVVEDMAVNTADVAKEDTIMTGTVNNAIAGGTVKYISQVKTEQQRMTIGELLKKQDNDEIGMDLPVQRKPDKWNEQKQSDLILSVLQDCPIPSVSFVDMDDKLMVADGIQRITALRKFKNDGFRIGTNKNEKLILTDEWGENSHVVSGKNFSELAPELQKRFLDFKLKTDIVTGADNDTTSDIFNHLNSGVPMSKAQTCRGALGIEMAGYMDELCQRDYIAKEGNYTTTQQKIDAPLESLLQGAMLLDNCFEHPGREIHKCKNISSAEVKRYCHFISKNYTEEQKKELEDVLEYLEGLEMEDNKIEKTMIPMLIVMGKLARINDVDIEDFTNWASRFRNKLPDDYKKNQGSTNISKPKTIGRLKAMRDSFAEYCTKHKISVDVECLKLDLFGSKPKKTSGTDAPDTVVTNEVTLESDSNVVDSEATSESDSNTGGSVTAPEPDSNTDGVDTAGNVSEEPKKEITE